MPFLRRFGTLICIAILGVVVASLLLRLASSTAPGVLTIAILNIGQGDSIYIQSPTGVEVIIDGGPDSSILRELPKRMRYADRTLDAVIATHPDADHIGGLVDLIPRYVIKNFIEPGIPKSTATAQALEDAVDTLHIPRVRAFRGMWLELGGGARLDILFPDFDVSNLPEDKANEGCVVARLTYKNTSALFMCDASFAVEDHLVVLDNLASTVLKVAHHGSKYSSGSTFLAEVDPQFAAISVGKNRYGHPTQEAIERIEAEGAKIYRTDVSGAVIFVSNGEKFEVTQDRQP